MPKGTPSKGYQLTKERQAILDILTEHGPIEDADGRATAVLASYTGHSNQNSLSAVLKPMEQVGLIEREVQGRRTFRIAAVSSKPSKSTVKTVRDTFETAEPAASAAPVSHGSTESGVDYELLAAIMLRKAVAALDAPSYQHEINELRSDLANAQMTLESLRAERDAMAEQLRITQHNLEVTKREAERTVRNTRAGTPIREQLDDQERKALDQLMRSLPTSR